MKISELKEDMRADVQGRVKVVDGPKTVKTKFGDKEKMWVVIEDETGSIPITVWGDECQHVALGTRVDVYDAIVESYKDKLQLKTDKRTKVRFALDVPSVNRAEGKGDEKANVQNTLSEPTLVAIPSSSGGAKSHDLPPQIGAKINALRIALEKAQKELDELGEMIK